MHENFSIILLLPHDNNALQKSPFYDQFRVPTIVKYENGWTACPLSNTTAPLQSPENVGVV